jgi:hypothetical protein
MLVTRHTENELNPWSFNKLETSFPRKPSPSLRMSNTGYETPLSTGTDWQGTYSFLPPGDQLFGQAYDHVSSSNDNTQSQSQPRSAGADGTLDVAVKNETSSPMGHRPSVDPLGLRQKVPSPIPEQPEPASDGYSTKPEPAHEESLVAGETTSLPLSAITSGDQGAEAGTSQPGVEEQIGTKEEDEDVIDDEEMIEGGGDGASQQPQTAAERTAQRRKMKRFR